MRITPDSINLKMSDREVPDGMLQESINVQWRDGSNKPIPYRVVSDIDFRVFYYVPSVDELRDIILFDVNNGGGYLPEDYFWSSTEDSDTDAVALENNGTSFPAEIEEPKYVDYFCIFARKRPTITGDALAVEYDNDVVYKISGGVTYLFDKINIDYFPWAGDDGNYTETGANSRSDGDANTRILLELNEDNGSFYESSLLSYTYDKIIAHKVGDENQVNMLGFSSLTNELYWFGVILDGTYSPIIPVLIELPAIADTSNISYTIVSGIIYVMSSVDKFYYNVQYDSTADAYESTNIYAWKDIGFTGAETETQIPIAGASNTYSTCGVIFVRYGLVLSTGEVVKHSTIYPHLIYGINSGVGAITKGDQVDNIHTCLSKQMMYEDLYEDVVKENIVAVNVYASVPTYKGFFESSGTSSANNLYYANYTKTDLLKTIKEDYDQLFYLVGTYDMDERNYTTDKENRILLYVSSPSDDVEKLFPIKVDMATIAAGEVMPVDNFSHHSLFGNIISNNGRVGLFNTTTEMTGGTASNNGLTTLSLARQGFSAKTEDGKVTSPIENIYSGSNANVLSNPVGLAGIGTYILTRGLLSYPDTRVEYIALSGAEDPTISVEDPANPGVNMLSTITPVIESKAVASVNSNLSVSIDIREIEIEANIIAASADLSYDIRFLYNAIEPFTEGAKKEYTSNDRLQFSEGGEFSVFPAIYSYRVGEGSIMFVGSNKVNPENADVVAPLMVGTSDALYTINLDITGATLVNSITKAKNLPAISAETLEIEGALLYVSDKGLIVVNNGNPVNITNPSFPEQYIDGFPSPNSIYPNYNKCLTAPSESLQYIDPSLYLVDDVVDYMKGAVMAYDGRRNNVWCSNPDYNYSLIYSLAMDKWSVSTVVFDEKVELFGIINGAYSRFLVKGSPTSGDLGQYEDNLLVLSNEDANLDVTYHMLTRPLKLGSSDIYKKIERFIARCQLYGGIFSLGLWGKQDINRNSVSIPLVAVSDNSTFKNGVRQDIPIGARKGKYKSITILQSGVTDQSSSIDGYDFDINAVDEGKLR